MAIGFTEEQALLEAQRCISCKNPTCIAGCPVEINIPHFILSILKHDYVEAADIIARRTAFRPSAAASASRKTNARRAASTQSKELRSASAASNDSLPIIKSIAASSRRRSIAPRQPVNASRWSAQDRLRSPPPAISREWATRSRCLKLFTNSAACFRTASPSSVCQRASSSTEIRQLENIGVEFVTSWVIGKTETVDELLDGEGYDAVFLGTGAGLPYFLNIPGENLAGIYSANEFLTRVNLMKGYKFPEYDTPVRVGKRVAVLGAGNTAMDAARVAMRLGPEKVYMVYRRSRAEVPARAEEVEHAEEEGIEFKFLTTPTQFFGDTRGWVTGMEVIDMELGEPDDSGRRRPVPIKGTEHSFDVDTVIVAVGQGPNPLVQSTTPGLNTTKWGNIITDETGLTSRPGLYAGGDVVRGGSTVILAMGDGKRAARSIHEYLMK